MFEPSARFVAGKPSHPSTVGACCATVATFFLSQTVVASTDVSPDEQTVVTVRADQAPAPASYPDALAERPGILPAGGMLVSAGSGFAQGHGSATLSLALGMLANVELTFDWTAPLLQRPAGDSVDAGLGVLIFLRGPWELDERLTLPIHFDKPHLRSLGIGPATSYTSDGGLVLSAFSELLQLDFETGTDVSVGLDIAIGYQATRRLFVNLTTYPAMVDVSKRTIETWLDSAAIEMEATYSLGRRIDVGLNAAMDNVRHPSAGYSVGIFATLKSIP